MNGRILAVIGGLLALWMAAGRWAFGIGGSLTWWYLPTIGIAYAALQLWIASRINITRDRGRRVGRSTLVALTLSGVSAIGFGLTVPDEVGGELESILGHLTGSSFGAEMSIALCNPLGIVTFALAIFALVFAYADARDPRPEEDEYPGEGEMIRHPLA